MNTKTIFATLGLTLFALAALPAAAQDILPRPEQPFGGKLGRTGKDSVKDFPEAIEARKGAPNIRLL